MKLQIKTIVERDIYAGDMFESGSEDFQELVNKLIYKCKFIAGTSHDNIMDYIGKNQGGRNTCSVKQIEVIDVNTSYKKVALLITWDYSNSVIIVQYDCSI